jgi:hypothetical protein
MDGIKNATWLLNRLSQSFIFKTAEPITVGSEPSSCVFHLRYSSQASRSTLERALAAIPEVELLSDTA